MHRSRNLSQVLRRIKSSMRSLHLVVKPSRLSEGGNVEIGWRGQKRAKVPDESAYLGGIDGIGFVALINVTRKSKGGLMMAVDVMHRRRWYESMSDDL